jgi:sulfofructose kinase
VGVGLNATDTLILLDEFPEYAGKVPFAEERLSPGGQVASAIVACAKWGLRTKYIGTVGDDLRGRIQRESLEGTGVDTSSLVVRSGCANQTAYILIDKRTGERTVLWQRPAGLQLRVEDIQKSDIVSSRMLHLDGYDTEAAGWAARIAREHGIPVSLDVDTIYPDFDRVLRNVDYLVASSSWPGRWTGYEDPFEALEELRREYQFPITAMTLGQNGAAALVDGNWYYSPGFAVNCVDTTGAGDIFHGAFCYAMLNRMNMNAALEFSNAAAALNCTALGARGHVGSLEEVRLLIASDRERHVSELATERGRETRAMVAKRQ